MASLTSREDAYWRKKGYHAENAECSCAMSKKDLFGFVDRVYVGGGGNIALVQITRTDHMQDRIDKILQGSTGHGQWRIRMAEIARRLLILNEEIPVLVPSMHIYVVGWQLDEATWRYQRTEHEIWPEELEAALRE